MTNFRKHHLLTLLNEYEQTKLPLDRWINLYFRSHKALGSKDRAFIAKSVYTMTRYKYLLDYLTPNRTDWESRYQVFCSLNLEKIFKDPNIPNFIKVSFPKWLYEKLVVQYGEKKAFTLCYNLNQQAPITIRVNTLKTDRDIFFNSLKKTFDVEKCQFSPLGIHFKKRVNIFQIPQFKQGYFEMQDEGSQLLAFLVEAHPKDLVLDFCAGSGGKTLAFAPRLKNQGQIYLHDIRKKILIEAKKRLKRAGIQNAQVILSGDAKLKKLKKKMDWVLVDAPCSGTGTLRRNPDMKEKINEKLIKTLVGKQRTIFEQALSFCKPKGKIIYATCSLLQEENEDQVNHFLNTYPIQLVQPLFKTSPIDSSMDGFFAAVFELTSNHNNLL